MTHTKTVLNKFEQTAAHYERELERYDPEQLTRKPGEDEWSVGQMYVHLIRSALYLHLANVDACRTEAREGDGSASVEQCRGEQGGAASVSEAHSSAAAAEGAASPAAAIAEAAGKTERGHAAFALGSFPPVAIRVPPSPQYTPPQPASKDEIVQGLRQVLARMRELEPVLASIPAEPTRPHPAFGALNAVEWFQLVEMHYRHHLLQKGRLDAFLGFGAAERSAGSADSGANAVAGTEAAAGGRSVTDEVADFAAAGSGFITRTPRYVREEALSLAGIACRTSLQDAAMHGTIAGAWAELHRRMGDIRGRLRPAVTFGLQQYPAEQFTPATSYTYVAAVLTDGSMQPDGIAVCRLEPASYAVFTYRGPVSGFGEAYRYIYDTWLPSSGCTPAAYYDFELYDERYTGAEDADSETDIYVPIVK